MTDPGETVIGETMAFCRVDGLALVVHHARDCPDAAEWAAYVDWSRTLLDRHGTLRTLVISGSGAPSSSQRSHYSSSIPGRETRLALVIGDPKVVPVAKVFAWFMPNVRVFRPGELHDGLAFLGVEPSPAFDTALADLSRRMGHTLERVGAR